MTTARPTAGLCWDVLLRDGAIAQVRPFTADDADALLALNHRVSSRSRLMRFFSVSERPAQWYVEQLVLQAEQGNALVGLVAGELVAVASFSRLESDPAVGDLGLLVDDAHQHSGLGSLLLEHLAHLARHRGVRAFHADVLAENTAMLRVLRATRLAITSETRAGVTELVVDLTEGARVHEAEQERDERAEQASLRRVLAPQRVAVVGSRRPGTVAHRVMASLTEYGFTGAAHAVGTAEELAAVAPLDLVVVAVPAAGVPEVARQAAAAGAGGLVVLSAGFAEAGPEGQQLQDEVLQVCRTAGMRLVGPNCLGVLNTDPAVRLDATFAPCSAPEGRVALFSQSGAVGVAALRLAARRRTGLSLLVSTGNKADVSGNDLLEYVSDDDRTAVVALYLESFGNPRKFARVVRALARRKPVVVVKAGRTREGAAAGRSHTAAAATPDAASDALLRACGAIRADDLQELLDLVTLLEGAPLPGGDRIAVIGNSGGAGVLAVDGVVSAGLRLAELTPHTQQALRAAVPEAASVVDPVDLLATVPPAQLQEALGVLLAAPEVDAVLAVCTPVDGPTEDAMARAVSAAATGSTPLLATFPGVADPPRELVGVPFFGHAEQAARALTKARRYAEWRAVPLAELTVPPPVVRTPALDALVADGGTGRWLPPSHVEELLRAVGIEVLPTVEVADASSAVAAAEEIGFPVVLKGHGPTLVHKADAGAVLLGLRSGREVAAAWFELSGRLGDAMSGGLVQRQLDTADGLELLAGASVDPEVGPLVLAGMGGTLTEVLDDRVLRVPPLTREEGLAQLAALRVGPALHGFRGRPAVDAPAAADVLVALGRLLASFPEVREVDLNPLLVTPTGACAVDARIAVGTPDPDPGAPFRALRQPLSRRTP